MSTFRGTLTVRKHVIYADDVRAAAITDVSGLTLGPEVKVSAGALATLAEAGIGIALAGHRAKGMATVVGPSSHDRVALRHIKQSEAGAPTRKRLWQAVVRSKIAAQAANLDAEAAERLLSVAKTVKSGDSGNTEGRAAKEYWKALRPRASWRRDPLRRDPWNVALNYGYGVVRNQTYASVFSAGLWPTLGIHHRHRSNSGCLVDDLMEPFRPLVDRIVFWEIASEEYLTVEDKRLLAGVLERETVEGLQVRASINSWAQEVGSYFENPSSRIPQPPVPVLDSGGEGDRVPTHVDHVDV